MKKAQKESGTILTGKPLLEKSMEKLMEEEPELARMFQEEYAEEKRI